MLRSKNTEDTIPDITNLVINASLYAKTNKVQSKISNIACLNTKINEVKGEILILLS